jgi:hypothetical protein
VVSAQKICISYGYIDGPSDTASCRTRSIDPPRQGEMLAGSALDGHGVTARSERPLADRDPGQRKDIHIEHDQTYQTAIDPARSRQTRRVLARLANPLQECILILAGRGRPLAIARLQVAHSLRPGQRLHHRQRRPQVRRPVTAPEMLHQASRTLLVLIGHHEPDSQSRHRFRRRLVSQ